MVTFTGIGCGGAESFLGGVSMVDIRGRAFLPSDFGIRARPGCTRRGGQAALRVWWAVACRGHPVGADHRESGPGGCYGPVAWDCGRRIQVSPRMPICLDAR